MQIRTRNNLIEWLEDNAPYPRIKRALVYGINENLGGFSRTLSHIPGWIIKIKGKKQEWIIAVISAEPVGGYFTFILKEIPWQYWEGDSSENPLYQGDFPEKYKSLRDKEIENVTP